MGEFEELEMAIIGSRRCNATGHRGNASARSGPGQSVLLYLIPPKPGKAGTKKLDLLTQ